MTKLNNMSAHTKRTNVLKKEYLVAPMLKKAAKKPQPYKTDQWTGWMQEALDGNQKSYHKLLTNLQGWLTAYYRKRVYAADVEDLVQDTLMTLHNKRQTYDPKQPFGPWIAALARYRWIDHLRANSKYANNTSFDADETDMLEAEIQHTPAAFNMVGDDVRMFLKKIPTAQAKVIELVKLQEFSIKEAADQTGHSEASVKVMVHRGLKKLQLIAAQSEKY